VTHTVHARVIAIIVLLATSAQSQQAPLGTPFRIERLNAGIDAIIDASAFP
jgi:hypothetical protein